MALAPKLVARLLIETVYDCVEAAGEEWIPSGHLYAMLLGKVSIDTYNAVMEALVVTGKITNNGHLLRVTGVPL